MRAWERDLFRWRSQSTVDPISLFAFLSSSFLRIHLHLFFLVRHLPRVSRFDQSKLAVILRQLLVFTTLHAPHFPLPFPVSGPLSLVLTPIGAFHNVRKTRWQ
jgi:hypothetical protein